MSIVTAADRSTDSPSEAEMRPWGAAATGRTGLIDQMVRAIYIKHLAQVALETYDGAVESGACQAPAVSINQQRKEIGGALRSRFESEGRATIDQLTEVDLATFAAAKCDLALVYGEHFPAWPARSNWPPLP